MEIVRIGDKVISINKIIATVNHILSLRSQGMSQQEVANVTGVERSFISRLEGMGEIRRGGRVAVIGFPLKNIPEIKQLLKRKGVEYSILFTEKERWEFIKNKTGLELFNQIMTMLQEVRSFDKVILIGSEQRVNMLSALIDKEVHTLVLGESPLSEDVAVDLEELEKVLEIC